MRRTLRPNPISLPNLQDLSNMEDLSNLQVDQTPETTHDGPKGGATLVESQQDGVPSKRHSLQTGLPRGAPPLDRAHSMPSQPSEPHSAVKRASKLKRSKSYAEVSWLRGYGASLSITQDSPTSPRNIELKITWKHQPTTFTIQLRTALFWFLILVFLIAPSSAFRAVPGMGNRTHRPQMSRVTQTQRYATDALAPTTVDEGAELLGEDVVVCGVEGCRLVDPMFEELADVVVKGSGFVADGDEGSLVGVASHLMHFLRSGELSMKELRSTAVKSCVTVMIHKVARVSWCRMCPTGSWSAPTTSTCNCTAAPPELRASLCGGHD